MDHLGFSMYRIMSTANKDSFTSSFPIWLHFIYFFPHLISLARTCSTKLSSNNEGECLCFVPNRKGKVLDFSIEYDASCEFSIKTFSQIEEVYFYLCFLKHFYHESNGFCQMPFLCQLRWLYVFLFSIYVMYYIF